MAPSKMAMDHLLERVHVWALRNEMAFGINKCATLVVKPLCIDSSPSQENPDHDHDPDPTFYLGTEPIPQTISHSYRGIPFKL